MNSNLSAPSWIDEVRAILTEQIDNPDFTNEELAERMGLSPRQLSRRTKAKTGMPPHQLLREIRLQRAKEILENRQCQTVTEVSYSVGFDTPHYFSRIFEKRFGKRPTTYLQAEKE